MRVIRSTSSRVLSRTARASSVSRSPRRLTSISERMAASGVRSSWEASATSRCCSATPCSRRASIALRVTARWPISSAAAWDGDALVQAVDADRVGLGGHPRDRQERLARQPPADGGGGRERGRAGDEQQHRTRRTEASTAVERLADDQDGARRAGPPGRPGRGDAARRGRDGRHPTMRESASARSARGGAATIGWPRRDAEGREHAAAPGRAPGRRRVDARQRGARDLDQLRGPARRVAGADVVRRRARRGRRASWSSVCRRSTRKAPSASRMMAPSRTAYQTVSRTRIGRFTRSPARSRRRVPCG